MKVARLDFDLPAIFQPVEAIGVQCFLSTTGSPTLDCEYRRYGRLTVATAGLFVSLFTQCFLAPADKRGGAIMVSACLCGKGSRR